MSFSVDAEPWEISSLKDGIYTGLVSTPGNVITTLYSLAGQNSYGTLNAGGTIRYGEIFLSTSSLQGKTITSVSIIMKKVGTPTGTVTMTIRDGATDTIQRTLKSFDASTIGTADTTMTSDTITPYTIGANDKILTEFSGGDASNNVQVRRQTDGFDTTNTHVSIYNASYGTDTNRDIAMTILGY